MTKEFSALQSYEFQPDTVLKGRFLVKQKIATGGMGNVFLCQDLAVGIPVAIKILHRVFQNDLEYLKRFSQEVAIASQIEHPNVVKIFELFQSTDLVFFSMEYVYGESLDLRLRRSDYSTQEISRLIIEIADGLNAIHKHSLIHRDLKPGNIMCQPDRSHKIIDFGVSKSPTSKLTKKNVRVGSISYIAPEIWLGKKAGPYSDLYSLGCLLYEVVNGHVPFLSENPLELMKQHCSLPVPEFKNEVSPWIHEIILKLLAKNPIERPTTEELIGLVRANNLESQSIQIFDSNHDARTVRSGQSMITVVDGWQANKGTFGAGSSKPKDQDPLRTQRQLVLSLKATRPAHLEKTFNKLEQNRRGKTLVLKLPMNSALIFNFELPSKDFLFLGIFLGSLNLFDWYLTHQGVSTFGLMAEGNDFLKSMMIKFGPKEALLYAKGTTIFIVFLLTIMARKSKMVKDLVGFLSLVYLTAAIIPWIYILYYK